MEISKELREARERLLEAEWAAPEWNPPFTKPREARKPKDDLIEVIEPPVHRFSLTQEALYVESLRQIWLGERAKFEKTVAECAAAKTTPPHNYWEKEHRARSRFVTALRILEALGG